MLSFWENYIFVYTFWRQTNEKSRWIATMRKATRSLSRAAAVWGGGAKYGARTNLAEPEFFCRSNETTFRQPPNRRFSPNLAMTHANRCPIKTYRSGFSKIFRFGVIYFQQTQNWRRSNRDLTQTNLSLCSLQVIVQGPGSFCDRSTFFVYDVRFRS